MISLESGSGQETSANSFFLPMFDVFQLPTDLSEVLGQLPLNEARVTNSLVETNIYDHYKTNIGLRMISKILQ